MRRRTVLWCLALCWLTSQASAATLERAREFYLSGDRPAARSELRELLASDEPGPDRAAVLQLLGQLEVDERNWQAALDAWSELTDEHALSPEATAISPAIRPLQALVECACEPAASPVQTGTERIATEGPAAAAPAVPAPTPAPSRTVAPAPGLLLVGAWGAEYDAAQEAVGGLIEFLESAGVGVRAASTEVPAIRGPEAVLSYLLEEAQLAGADGVLFMKSRFDFREYVEITRYDLDGNQIWRDKTTGSRSLKESRYRGKPSWSLVERVKTRLSKRIGTPDLPTAPDG